MRDRRLPIRRRPIALSGVMTLTTGSPIFALISAVTGALLYASSRALGIAIARDVD